MQAIELVTYLKQRGAASVDELMGEFNVSSRTVRLHVQRTNDALAGLARIAYSRRAGGYVLTVSDEEGFRAWCDRMHRFSDVDATAAGKRVSYLVNDLLARNDWVTISSMAKVLYVSPQSISKDLKAVEAKLAEFGLALEKKPRYGVRVQGSELARRLCLASAASEDLIGSHPFGDEALPQVVKTIADCIERALAQTPVYMSMLAFQNLVVHTVV
ncbi:BglG family transcription antiterminator, partial [Enorma phocaeensis]|nr:HTH domain-containing protein [Enorma phocaeensis]